MFLRAKATILSAALFAVFCIPGAVLAAGYTFTPSVSAELAYESNANLVPDDEDSNGDFILKISPAIELVKDFKRLRLKSAYTPSGYVYFREQNLNVITHAVSFEASASLSERDSMTVSDTLSYRKDSAAAGVAGELVLQLRRASIFSNVTGVGLSHRFTPQTSAELSLSESFFRVDNADGITKTWSDTAEASVSFGLPDNSAINTVYTFTQSRFSSLAGRSSIDSHSWNIGISHHFPYSLDVLLSVGVAYMPDLNDHYTVLAGLSVEKSFQRLSMALDYERSITIITGLSSLPDETDKFGFGWDYVLTHNSELSFLGTYTSHRTVSLEELRIDQYGASLTARWHVSPKTTLGCGYSYMTQVSYGTLGDDFKRNNFYVSVTYTPYQKRF